MKAFSIRVSGRVQGVFFRASTKETAEHLGICGWCKNEPDGSVLIHAEGGQEAMEEFLSWCGKGPKFANVERLEKKEEVFESFKDFKIRRF